MVNNLYVVLATIDETPGYITDLTLETGISTTVIGMGVVFLVLIALYVLFKGISALDTAQSKKEPKEKKTKKSKAAAVDATADLDTQTVAAIVAAVEVYCGKPAQQLRFTAIRRNNNAWQSSGTADIIHSRQQNL